VVLPKSLLVMGNTLKVISKPRSTGEFFPASEDPGTDISSKYPVPTVQQILYGRICWFGWKGVVQNADKLLRGRVVRLEPVTSLCKGIFNTLRKETGTPGVSGSDIRQNFRGESFLGTGSVCIIYELAKARGGEATLALSRFDMLGDARNCVEYCIAAETLVSGSWFGLVDLVKY